MKFSRIRDEIIPDPQHWEKGRIMRSDIQTVPISDNDVIKIVKS
jgi:hypothetical protein